jgi:hypothetical protein
MTVNRKIKGFHSGRDHWILPIDLIPPAALWPGVDSAYNRNEYQFLWVKGSRSLRMITSPPSVSRLEFVVASMSHAPTGTDNFTFPFLCCDIRDADIHIFMSNLYEYCGPWQLRMQGLRCSYELRCYEASSEIGTRDICSELLRSVLVQCFERCCSEVRSRKSRLRP